MTTTPSAVRNIPLDKLVPVPDQCPQDAALGGRRRRAEGQHPGPRLEAEPRRSPLGRREGRPRRHRRRPAAQGVAGARRRGRHSRRFQGSVPGRGARGGARDLADGEPHPRRPAPADEFVAMAALIDAGEPIEAVATRFGVSERHVRQRLRLGKLAPELLDAYRNGDISLDVDHRLHAWRRSSRRSSPCGISSRTSPTSRPIRCGVC